MSKNLLLNILAIVSEPNNYAEQIKILDSIQEFHVMYMTSINKAVEAIAVTKFDAIITIMSIGKMNGIGIVKTLQEQTPQLPILLLTSVKEEKKAVRLLKEGAQEYLLTENISESMLRRSIHHAIEKKRSDNYSATLAAIVEASDDAIFSKSLQGIITSWNAGAEKLYGYRKNEILGKPVTLLIPSNRESEFWEIMDKIRNGERLRHYETLRVNKSGQILDVSITVSPVFDSNGRIVGASSIGRNISERKKIEQEIKNLNEQLEERVKQRTEQLETTNHELESFSYSVSHDLRAPLRAVNGFAQLLIDNYSDTIDSKGNRYLINIKNNATRMDQLIDGLLSFSKIGRKQLTTEQINMNLLLDTVVDEIKMSDPEYKAEIEIAELPAVYADRMLIKQVFANLISNALKFTRNKKKAKIKIGYMYKDGQIIYNVKDNGVGFDMHYYDKLFGVFQRLHSDDEYEGNGVGLAIVQRIVSKHGGAVWAESGINKGATFYVSLPKK